MSGEAILTSDRTYTSFIYGGRHIRFMTSPHLKCYTKVISWDRDGYIVVRASYDGSPTDEEEYIDLQPILRRLYIDPRLYLKDLQKVSIEYDK